MIQPHIGDHDHHVNGGDSGEMRKIYVYLESLSNTLIIIYDNIMMLIVCPFKKKVISQIIIISTTQFKIPNSIHFLLKCTWFFLSDMSTFQFLIMEIYSS